MLAGDVLLSTVLAVRDATLVVVAARVDARVTGASALARSYARLAACNALRCLRLPASAPVMRMDDRRQFL